MLQSAITYIIDSKYIYRLLLLALGFDWVVGVSYGSRGVFVNDKVTFHEDKEQKWGRVWVLAKEELATSRQTDDIIHQQRLGRDQQQ